jgi:hypothetical protein
MNESKQSTTKSEKGEFDDLQETLDRALKKRRQEETLSAEDLEKLAQFRF